MSSARISPTAHYTGQVWVREGFAGPEFDTWQGRALHAALRPVLAMTRAYYGANPLDTMLVQRHAALDELVARSIEHHGVMQVLELAAGLSPRGVEMKRRFPGIRYVEVDLPAMARTKRALLDSKGLSSEGHEVVAGDILATSVALSLGSLVREHFAEGEPAVVVTEGLLNYFSVAVVEQLWRDIANTSDYLGDVHYVTETHLMEDVAGPFTRGFIGALSTFARGAVTVHFDAEVDALSLAGRAGFGEAKIIAPRDAVESFELPTLRRGELIRVLVARSR